MPWDDEKISQLFQDAKHADEECAPSFERTLTRSRTRPDRLRMAPLISISALAVVLALSAIVFVSMRTRSHSADSLAELQTTPALLQWRSPTHFLLQTPGHELHDSLPAVGRIPAFAGNGNQAALQSQGARR